ALPISTLWRPLEAPQRLAAQLADDSTEFSRSTRADLVVMNHSERIPDMPHVDSGDAAPTAADRIERLATCFLEPGQSRKFGIDIVHQVSVLKPGRNPERPERQGRILHDPL